MVDEVLFCACAALVLIPAVGVEDSVDYGRLILYVEWINLKKKRESSGFGSMASVV
jgi:hypothetical protein